MVRAYNQIFWGAMLTFFNINFGWFNLLPDFLGYIVIAMGIENIIDMKNDDVKKSQKAHILAWVLAIYAFASMFIGASLDFITSLVLTVAFLTGELIMCYFVLASGRNYVNSDYLPVQIRDYLLITTLAIAIFCFSAIIPVMANIAMLLSFVSKIYFIYLCYALKGQFTAIMDKSENINLD